MDKIKFIDLDALVEARHELAQVEINSKRKLELFKEEFISDNLRNSKYNLVKIDLEFNELHNEIDNVIKFYNAFKFLTPSEASDERLWVALSFENFFGYVCQRSFSKSEYSSSRILEKFFFGYGPRRSLTRNTLARLWWIAKLTYDPVSEDPYVLTKYICTKQDLISSVLERDLSNSIDLVRPLVKCLKNHEDLGQPLSRAQIRELLKYYNLIGSTYLVDCANDEWIMDKLDRKITKILKEVQND